jgi:HlyD family secretion protein
MRQHKTVWLGGIAVLVMGVGAWAHLKKADDPEYRTTTVDRGNITSTISATGNLNAVITVEVGSQVSGNISQLFADFNSRVQKGQLVARIDPEIFQARVTQAQANLDAARANVQNAQANLQKNEAEIANAKAQLAIAQANLAKEKVNTQDALVKYNRQMELFREKLIATADRDTAQTAYDAAKAAVDSAQAQVQAASDNVRAAMAQEQVAETQVASAKAQAKQQEAALRQSQIDLQHTYIYAPVDGTVVSRKVDVGQTVAASLQAPTLFEIAQDLTKMQVDTNVDEADIGRVAVGQDAMFTVDAYPTQKFHGKVVEIRKAPINVQNVVTYDVVIAVPNPDLKLFPGMTANVNILVDRRENALRIPNAALRFHPPEAQPKRAAAGFGGGPGARMHRKDPAAQTVYVLDADGKPAPVEVTLGTSDGVYTEVASGNLKEGEAVITGMAAGGDMQAGRGGSPFGMGGRMR